ncbi:glycine zipper family protein [Candidatus Nitrospira salsa]
MISLCVFSGCSGPRPVLYPNQALQDSGEEQAEQDISVCEELAEEYVSKGSAGEHVAGQTVGGGAIGAASGAVGGAIAGNVGLGSMIGAAAGATQGLLRGIFTSGGAEASPAYRNFVNRCLIEKGYEPIGWD